MTKPHGVPPRGLLATKSSPLFQGFFGRMFRNLPPAKFGATDQENIDNLNKLGVAMVSSFDAPKDGADDEESGIPALYTYLGQFIDHDLTFDPSSIQQKHKDPDALVDFRKPAFDLDNVYGRGPDDQPYMYDGDKLFLLGTPIGGGLDPDARDLPRNSPTPPKPARALIGDPRNDENSIVSQLQGLFLRFHNRTVADNPSLSFRQIQRDVRFHYQYIVLHDFLPRIVHSKVLSALKSGGAYDPHKLRFYHFRNHPFMPVEFAAAAYRLGHSMIRPGYRLNDNVLRPIFPVPAQGFPEGLTGFRAMNPAWGIDWGRFIDIDVRPFGGEDAPDSEKQKRLQFAYRIDTSAVTPLGDLPLSVAGDKPSSLPQRNLQRGWRLGLPSGQSVAKAMGVTPLSDDQIVLGKFLEKEPPAGDPDAPIPITEVSKVFAGNCPLWTYILAEARYFKESVKLPFAEMRVSHTPRLGPVGGRIVAEVVLGIMFGDNQSMLSLHPDWIPNGGTHYALRDFVLYALGK